MGPDQDRRAALGEGATETEFAVGTLNFFIVFMRAGHVRGLAVLVHRRGFARVIKRALSGEEGLREWVSGL